MKYAKLTYAESGSEFEDGLFGINMEITRKGYFGGLSAQMLNNRKLFSGSDCPAGWQMSGFEYIKDRPELSLCRSNFVLLKDGRMSQTSNVIETAKEVRYTAKLWVKALTDSTVAFGLAGCEQVFNVSAVNEKYTELSFEFVGDDVKNGCFSVTVKGRIYVFEASLMPSDDFYGMRRDVIEALRELAPSSVRIPGGCAADHFDWKDTLQAPEFRKPAPAGDKWFLFPDTYDQDCMDIGINELLLLCKELGAEPEYTVSMILSDGEDAARLVEYCNGSADTEFGAKRQALGLGPCGIRIWYIGNEAYFFGGKYRDDPLLAARQTCELIRSMKAADGSIEPVIGLTWGADYRSWSRTFADALDCEYEYVSYHNYIGILPDQTQGENGMATPEMVEQLFRDGKDIGLEFYKNGLYKDGFGRIKVCADEWNYSWGRNSSNVLFLSNALQFHFFAKNGAKYHVRRAEFFTPVNEGMITVDGRRVTIESSGKMFRLMRGHCGGKIIRIDADPSLDVLCTKHGDKLFVSAANRCSEPEEFMIEGYRMLSGTQIETDGFSFKCNSFRVYETAEPVVKGHSVLFMWLEPAEQ